MVWRVPTPLRVLAVGGYCLFELLVIFAVTQAPDNPLAWVFLVGLTLLGVFNVAFARRSCTIGAGKLIAKGRFATRRVNLADLRQVAIGAGGHIWIQTHHPLDRRGGTVLSLRMIPVSKLDPNGGPSGDRAVRFIRDQAVAAGAELDPPMPDRKVAPSKKALIFGI
jgi:hypothetical protein